MDHEFEICDDYLTWGWSEYSNKCTRGFLPKPVKEVFNKKDNNKFLLVLLDSFKHTKFIDSNPILRRIRKKLFASTKLLFFKQ